MIDKVKRLYNDYKKLYIIAIVSGIFIYSTMIFMNLYNTYDAVWIYNILNREAGTWERAAGRFLWPYIDRFRMGIVLNTFNSIISIALYELGNILIIDLFGIRQKLSRLTLILAITASPVISASLTYVFMSPTFACAFFFSILAAYFFIKNENRIIRVIGGGVFLTLSMGCYQAYIGVCMFLILLVIVLKLFYDEKYSGLIRDIASTAVMVVCTGVMYYICVHVVLAVYGESLGTYKGAGSISPLGMMIGLPASIRQSYQYFINCFLTNAPFVNQFHLFKIQFLAWLVIAGVILVRMIRNVTACARGGNKAGKTVIRYIIVVLLLLLIPLACNFVFIIAGDQQNSIIMQGATATALPIMLAVLFERTKWRNASRYIVILPALLLVWANVLSVTNDQVTLLSGRKATLAMANSIVADLDEYDYDPETMELIIIGKPSDNSSYLKSEAYRMAADYAKFGDWWSSLSGDHDCWEGFLWSEFGMDLNYLAADELYYWWVDNADEVNTMPIWPSKGSTKRIGNILVVRVSEQWY